MSLSEMMRSMVGRGYRCKDGYVDEQAGIDMSGISE